MEGLGWSSDRSVVWLPVASRSCLVVGRIAVRVARRPSDRRDSGHGERDGAGSKRVKGIVAGAAGDSGGSRSAGAAAAVFSLRCVRRRSAWPTSSSGIAQMLDDELAGRRHIGLPFLLARRPQGQRRPPARQWAVSRCRP